ncbi:hypothetical protein DOY81_010137 [Sarcophaga bullata]|nr:hypothetical protein DOY81_010137 [Sarcophaga bullata]
MGKLLNPDLEIALQFCSHLVYGYMGIKPNTHQVFSLHEDLDVHKHHIGGDKDIDPEHPDKYLELLEGERVKQTAFINTAYTMVRHMVLMASIWPTSFPREQATQSSFRHLVKVFTGDFVVDPNADMHKEQFTTLIRDLRNALKPDVYFYSNCTAQCNSTWYFDVPAVSNFVDFVNLAAFDFLTPDRNPDEAGGGGKKRKKKKPFYTAPLYEPYDQNRLPHYNVTYWLQHQCPAHKIILGMATYGRAWKMSSDSGNTGEPVVPKTEGPAEADMQSQTPGLLSWPEICYKLPNPSNSFLKGANAPLKRVSDPTKRYGTYAYRPADANGKHGIWISYEDPDSASNKASYVRSKGLGGLALFDLSYDDFRGSCTGDRYPLLRAAKYLGQLTLAANPNMVCFYDASSVDRDGLARFSTPDFEIALQFCTHLIYGYAGINSENFHLKSLHNQRERYTEASLCRYNGIETEIPTHKIPLDELLRIYNFDGLDLAFQLPRNKARKVHSGAGSAWKSFKKLFNGDFIVDEKADEHKEQFTNFVSTLKSVFNNDNFMITLTVLPNVNSTWYFNALLWLAIWISLIWLLLISPHPHAIPKKQITLPPSTPCHWKAIACRITMLTFKLIIGFRNVFRITN